MFKLRRLYTVENSPARETLANKKNAWLLSIRPRSPHYNVGGTHQNIQHCNGGGGGAIEFKLVVSRLFLPSMDSGFMN